MSEVESQLIHVLLQFDRALLLSATIQFKLSLLGHECVKCLEFVSENLDIVPVVEFIFTKRDLDLVSFFEVDVTILDEACLVSA